MQERSLRSCWTCMNRRYLQLSLRKERIALEMIPPLQSSHPLREIPSGNEPDPARSLASCCSRRHVSLVSRCFFNSFLLSFFHSFHFSLSFLFFLINRIKSLSLISPSCHSLGAIDTNLDQFIIRAHLFIYSDRKFRKFNFPLFVIR